MHNRGEIIALDIYPHRVKLVEAACRRLGVLNVSAYCLDARKADASVTGTFDRILLDVPCSGFGVLRNKPDLKWRRREQDIRDLALVQKELLRSAAKVLRPGGTIVYSTCTNEPEETGEVISWFTATHPVFSVRDFSAKLPEAWGKRVSFPGIHMYPHIHRVDGFFVCKLTRLP